MTVRIKDIEDIRNIKDIFKYIRDHGRILFQLKY